MGGDLRMLVIGIPRLRPRDSQHWSWFQCVECRLPGESLPFRQGLQNVTCVTLLPEWVGGNFLDYLRRRVLSSRDDGSSRL